MKKLLIDLIKARVSTEAWNWFQKVLQDASGPAQKDLLLSYYTGASRKLGKQTLLLEEKEKAWLRSLDPLLRLDGWGMDDAGRAVLLLSLTHLPAGEYAELVLKCYELGDSREQQSWLRALSLFPQCERFLAIAVDACRTNILPLFESIACENPFPFLHFPELNFNQMVLKSLFNRITLTRIVGLDRRFNSELSRMADDYVSEREAAGREVPPDIWWVIVPRIAPERFERIYRYLHHQNPNHRYWAAVGLGFARDEASRAELEMQRNLESEPKVCEAIDASLAKMAQ